jgi:hypothetical protein
MRTLEQQQPINNLQTTQHHLPITCSRIQQQPLPMQTVQQLPPTHNLEIKQQPVLPSKIQNLIAAIFALQGQQPTLNLEQQQLQRAMEILLPVTDPVPANPGLKRSRGRVCKLEGCPFCTREACGNCGNCRNPRKNKCIRR